MPFMTKNAKKQMRLRKAKLSKQTKEPSSAAPSSSSTQITLTSPIAPPPAPAGLTLISTASGPVPGPALGSATALLPPATRRINVPIGLEGQALRDFRKKARRALKKELGPAYSDSLVKFVGGEERGGRGGGRKRTFASISRLVKEEEEERTKEKEDGKRAKKEEKLRLRLARSAVPDSEKGCYLALDCEMVGVGASGKRSALARTTLVSHDGDVVYDTLVEVGEAVSDFRTKFSGIRAKDLKGKGKDGLPVCNFKECQSKVAKLLEGKVLVGHALKNDLSALMLDHPKHMIRDTARYSPFQRVDGRGKLKPRKLKALVAEHLKEEKWSGFQGSEHDSSLDAGAAMELYKLKRGEWEQEVERKGKKVKRKGKGGSGGYKNVEGGEGVEEDDYEVDDDEVE